MSCTFWFYTVWPLVFEFSILYSLEENFVVYFSSTFNVNIQFSKPFLKIIFMYSVSNKKVDFLTYLSVLT